jgi:hypothetical protein
LRAVVQAEERGADANEAAFGATDLPRDEVIRCLARLQDDGYLDVRLNPGDNTSISAHVVKALPKALREVELWPPPTATLEKSEHRRLIIMQQLRARRGDDTLNPIKVEDIAAVSGRTTEDLETAVHYLTSEGLIEHHFGNQVSLTHPGLVEMEALERQPDQPTPHLPAISITIGDDASGVQISAGSPGTLRNSSSRPTTSRSQLALCRSFAGCSPISLSTSRRGVPSPPGSMPHLYSSLRRDMTARPCTRSSVVFVKSPSVWRVTPHSRAWSSSHTTCGFEHMDRERFAGSRRFSMTSRGRR